MINKKYTGKYYKIPKKSNSGAKKTKRNSSNINFANILAIFEKTIYKVKSMFTDYWIILVGIGFGIVIAFVVIIVSDFYKVKALTHFKPNVVTKVYDKNGLLVSELFRQKREVVLIDKIPKHLINAFIAMEDNDFYHHFGVNPKGIVRAFFINILAGRVRQGGSTITQQLSKILLTSRKRNIFRKIKEAFIAVMMDYTYSKDKILELYLNQIFLGHGAYGVETASKLYFDKHVWELNLAECALIATLPSAPNRLSPIKYPERSRRMHKIALSRMVDLGFITIKEAEKTYKSFWKDYYFFISEKSPTITAWSSRINKAPWFTEYIRRKLVKKYGEDKVYNEGLIVYTTLDLKKQEIAQNKMNEALKAQSEISSSLAFKNEDYIIEKYYSTVEMFSLLFDINTFAHKGSQQNKKINNKFQKHLLDELELINFFGGLDSIGEFCKNYKKLYFKDKDFQNVEGALVTINQSNGHIEAMVGGREFSSINQLNRVLQSKRQPGSAIKPLLYSAALQSKLVTPATTVLDSPMIYLDNEGGDWIPENYEGEYFGLIRLRNALRKSINVVSIKLSEIIGIDNVLNTYAKLLRMNKSEMKRRIPRNLSIALGSFEVSPFELGRAYAIIANGGKEVIPYSIRYIKDRNGTIIENTEKEIKEKIKNRKKSGELQILDAETSQILIGMMKTVVTSGTGMAAALDRPTAGKTGTTNNWRDAWFVGFTPEVTTCLWVGYDSPGMSLGQGQTGGGVAARIWGDYMAEAMKGQPVKEFPNYANLSTIRICEKSGKIPKFTCHNIIDEVFIPGTEPVEECSLDHQESSTVDLNKKGPKKNIVSDQDKQIYRQIRKKKDSSSILDNIGDDLFD